MCMLCMYVSVCNICCSGEQFVMFCVSMLALYIMYRKYVKIYYFARRV